MKLLEMQERAAERGEPEVVCVNCSHFYIRVDGPVFMGRCALRDEPQFAYGTCIEYELPSGKEDPDMSQVIDFNPPAKSP